MKSQHPFRGRIIGLACAFTVFYLGGWYLFSYKPHSEKLERDSMLVAGGEARVRQSRAAILRLGGAGLDREIQRLRGEAEHLARLAPPRTDDTDGAARRVRERLGQLASQYGVQAPQIEPLPMAEERGVSREGFRIRATGGYHELGGFFAEALSMERLTRVGEAKLSVIPDSVLRDIPPRGGVGDPAAAAVTTGVQGDALDATVDFTLNWFSLPPEAAKPAGADSAVGGVPAAGSGAYLEVAP